MTRGGAGAGRLLVVGAGGFIARHFLAACAEPVRAVGHDAIDRPDLLDGVDRVLGCARHPLLGSEDYDLAAMDPDLRLAERVARRDVDYVLLSSRKSMRRARGRSPKPTGRRRRTCMDATSWPSRRLCARGSVPA